MKKPDSQSWELSYYTALVPWQGGQLRLPNREVHTYLQALSDAKIRWIGVDGINILEPCECPLSDIVSAGGECLHKFDLRLSSLHYAGPVYAPLDDGQSRIQDLLAEFLERFSVWNPRVLVIHAGWADGCLSTCGGVAAAYIEESTRHGEAAVIETIVDNLKTFALGAQAYGIRLALENVGYLLPLADSQSVCRLVSAISESNVGFCVDSGHAHAYGESVPDLIKRAGTRLFETHFHDNRALGRELPKVVELSPPTYIDEHLPVGFGTISWLDVIKALWDIDFQGPVTFETTGWPTPDPVHGLRLAAEWWQTCVAMAAHTREAPERPESGADTQFGAESDSKNE